MLFGHYEKETDRESAYEKLKVRTEQVAVQEQEKAAQKEQAKLAKQKSPTADLIDAFAKSAARAVGSQVGRQILRGIFGSMLGKGKK